MINKNLNFKLMIIDLKMIMKRRIVRKNKIYLNRLELYLSKLI